MEEEFHDAKDWSDSSEGVMRFSLSLTQLEGPLSAVLPKLQRVLAIDPDAQIANFDSDGYYHKICWKRPLTAEEFAEMRDREAGWERDRVDGERREYERLKAKFGE